MGTVATTVVQYLINSLANDTLVSMFSRLDILAMSLRNRISCRVNYKGYRLRSWRKKAFTQPGIMMAHRVSIMFRFITTM